MQRTDTTPRNKVPSFATIRPSFTCNECGQKFQQPLLATVTAAELTQKYYACPRCMTKIGDIETHRSRETDEKPISASISMSIPEKPETETENGGTCPHFLGYLKKRPKNMQIPDECLTCDKTVECLVN